MFHQVHCPVLLSDMPANVYASQRLSQYLTHASQDETGGAPWSGFAQGHEHTAPRQLRSLGVIWLRICFFKTVLDLSRRLLELPDALADGSAHVGKLTWPEHDESYDEYQYELCCADVEHVAGCLL